MLKGIKFLLPRNAKDAQVVRGVQYASFTISRPAAIEQLEEKIILSLNSILKNTTTIISSHRLSSVQNLNEIIVLDKGKIIQKGNHELLINQNGYYKDVYSKQLMKKDDKI